MIPATPTTPRFFPEGGHDEHAVVVVLPHRPSRDLSASAQS
ncbi:hypothetical protein [Rhodococcus sp. R1101]|nr:hypothetical protein [Rhodococcus sp. R1101]